AAGPRAGSSTRPRASAGDEGPAGGQARPARRDGQGQSRDVRAGTRDKPPGAAGPPAASGGRATNLRDAMAPAVRRPGAPSGSGPRVRETPAPPRPAGEETGRVPRRRPPAGNPAGRAGAARSGAARAGTLRPGQRRALLRPVPDLDAQSSALAKLPLLERPLASYYLLGSSAGLLLLLGLVMVLSASNVRSYEAFGSSYTIFVRQATWMGIGLPVLLAASRMPARVFRRVSYPLMALTLLLLLAVLSPLGVSSNGAQRWLGVGSLTLQPSELAKLALVLWSADLLTRKRRLLGDWKHLIIPIVPMTALVGGLIMLQPDMGTTIVVFSVLFVVLWVVGTPGRVYGGLLGVIAVVGTILAVIEPYRLERLLSYRDPFDKAQDSGWQAVHGIYALSSGGWWGEGLGASREKWPDLLPASYTDFILAIIGEELGLLGCLLVVLLFGVFGYAGLRVAHRSDNHFVRLAAAGSTGWILTQAVVNMGAVVGLLPITGIPLPLVSFGGSSLVPTMLSIGMLLAFARSEPAAARLLAERARERREARSARQGRRGSGRPRPGDREAPAGKRVARRPGRAGQVDTPARGADRKGGRRGDVRRADARSTGGRGGNARDGDEGRGRGAGQDGRRARERDPSAPARARADAGGDGVRDARPARPARVSGRPRPGSGPARAANPTARRPPRVRSGEDSTGGAPSAGEPTSRPPAEPGPYRRPPRPDPNGPPAAG
ncbi:putative lipid II flippase FtsW, partial [Pseudofrankia sp. BMG5.36]|uniref:putative lipid II flippase FtsW n=1 Tax=Pseudofrankia sp. BMG5.36 TaxID=1834512 RepID=UPI000A71914C